MAIENLQFIQPWYDSEKFGRVIAVTCENSHFGKGPVAESFEQFRVIRMEKTSDTYEKHTDTCKSGADEWLVHKFESNKDVGFNNHRSQIRAMVDRPAKLTQTTSIMEPSWDRHNVPNCPEQINPAQHNQGQTDHGVKQINHGKVHWQDLGWRRQMDATDIYWST